MNPLRAVGRFLARKDLDEVHDQLAFWHEVAHKRYMKARNAQAAAALMLDGIDVGKVHLEITRTCSGPASVSIRYGDTLVLDGEVHGRLERIEKRLTP